MVSSAGAVVPAGPLLHGDWGGTNPFLVARAMSPARAVTPLRRNAAGLVPMAAVRTQDEIKVGAVALGRCGMTVKLRGRRVGGGVCAKGEGEREVCGREGRQVGR